MLPIQYTRCYISEMLPRRNVTYTKMYYIHNVINPASDVIAIWGMSDSLKNFV